MWVDSLRKVEVLLLSAVCARKPMCSVLKMLASSFVLTGQNDMKKCHDEGCVGAAAAKGGLEIP